MIPRPPGPLCPIPDEVIHVDGKRGRQLAEGVDGPGAAARLNLDDLHAVDAASLSERNLGKLAELSPNAQGRLVPWNARQHFTYLWYRDFNPG